MSEILNILGSVGFNWHVALANFVNFLIILFLLNKFFFGRIGKVLNDRQAVITRGLNNAKESERKLTELAEEKKNILHDAHEKRDEIVAQAESLAKGIALSVKEEADKEIHSRLLKIKEEEASLSAAVEKAFLLRAPELVIQMYRKTLAKELTEEENNALISRINI